MVKGEEVMGKGVAKFYFGKCNVNCILRKTKKQCVFLLDIAGVAIFKESYPLKLGEPSLEGLAVSPSGKIGCNLIFTKPSDVRTVHLEKTSPIPVSGVGWRYFNRYPKNR